MNPEPQSLYDPTEVPVLLQSAARHLRLAEQALADASKAPKEAFAPLAEKENLSFLSECLTRQETMAEQIRRIVIACREAYHSDGSVSPVGNIRS